MRKPTSAADGLTLLKQFRQRHDLLVKIAEEIDDLLQSPPPPHSPGQNPVLSTQPLQESTSATPHSSQSHMKPHVKIRRGTAAFIFGAAGLVLSALSLATIRHVEIEVFLGFTLMAATVSAGAGSITGMRKRRIQIAIASAIASWVFVLAVFAGNAGDDTFAIGGVFGMPAGLLLGAVIPAIVAKVSGDQT